MEPSHSKIVLLLIGCYNIEWLLLLIHCKTYHIFFHLVYFDTECSILRLNSPLPTFCIFSKQFLYSVLQSKLLRYDFWKLISFFWHLWWFRSQLSSVYVRFRTVTSWTWGLFGGNVRFVVLMRGWCGVNAEFLWCNVCKVTSKVIQESCVTQLHITRQSTLATSVYVV